MTERPQPLAQPGDRILALRTRVRSLELELEQSMAECRAQERGREAAEKKLSEEREAREVLAGQYEELQQIVQTLQEKVEAVDGAAPKIIPPAKPGQKKDAGNGKARH